MLENLLKFNFMKEKSYPAFLGLLFYLLMPGVKAQLKNTGLQLHQGIGKQNDVSANWQTKAFTYLQNGQYNFKSADEKSFDAVNDKNKMGVHISPGGYLVRCDGVSAGFIVKSVAGIKVGMDHLVWVENKGNTLLYHYSKQTIEYKNNEEGLRQNFILTEKGATASVTLKIKSSLRASLINNRLVLKDKSGKKRFYYEGMKVWDANGKMLDGAMRLKGDELVLNVDDKNAVYPVTIDPLNHTPEWSTSADGVLPGLLTNLNLQVQTLYGFTVAGLGDVNGDGFDDVAVSAPAMADVVSGTGILTSVGAVFVYLGSATGLPTAPSYVLQPATAVTGALFGFSVTGGDVTGDGISDIIVGAPLDRVQASIGGVANATVGKVYIYKGGATLTGQNPTPLLNIHLDNTLLTAATVSLNPLFGFSVAVTDDLNGDGKGEIIVGSPTYARLDGVTAVKTGGAFVYLSDPSDAFTTVKSLTPPTGSVLGLYNEVGNLVTALPLGGALWGAAGPILAPVLNGQVDGLLFGFSVDGTGDYDNDGFKDILVGSPAGVNLGTMTSGLSLNGAISNLLNNQILGGSAYVFASTATDISTSSLARLQSTSTGLLSNTANLFGYCVRGVRDASGNRNGNMLTGAPVGAVLSNVVGGLKVQAGQMHVFKKQLSAPSSPVSSDQVIGSPRGTNILSLLSGNLTLGILYASSIDNMRDVNCDGIGDIIVGEPLSTSIGLLNANAVGGAAYIYLGKSDGTYADVPSSYWNLTSQVSPLVGVNATALLGYSVAGAGHVYGTSQGVRALVGGPANSLDFGAGLLNLGNTVGTMVSFTFDNNGLGKAYTFPFNSCNTSLPVQLVSFGGVQNDNDVLLSWATENEINMSRYELQSSVNGRDFTCIAIAPSNSSENHNKYHYNDVGVSSNVVYYRLKLVNENESFTYSNVLQFRLDKASSHIQVYPNPVNTGFTVGLQGMEAGAYRIELVNTLGQVQFAKQLIIEGGSYAAKIDRNDIPAGIYFVRISNLKIGKVESVSVIFQ
jgi:hypothetical protein